MENIQTTTNDGKAKKVALLSLGTLTLSALAFFGIKQFKKSKNKTHDNINQAADPVDHKIPVQSSTSNPARPRVPAGGAGASFPLRINAKGDKVLALQHALMRTYGSGIFPKFGADGVFGSELEGFLKSKGYSVPLSEENFKKITQPQQAAPALIAFVPAAIAKGIYNAIMAKDHKSAITLMKAIGNTANYSLVSEKFQLYRVNGSVRQTLVNGMLRAFPEKSQKEETEAVFRKIGLKQNLTTKQWSLNGL